MKKLLFVILAAVSSAGAFAAQCRDVYNPMENRWDYVCVPDNAPPPVCHQQYDPMNNVWVTVCE